LDPGVATALAAIVGGIAGAAVAVAVQVIRGDQEASLDRARRADDRKIESDRLQRATLLEIQERLAEWMDLRQKLMVTCTILVAGEGQPSAPELSREAAQAARQLDFLAQRVLDDPLRKQIEAVQAIASIADGGMRKHSVTLETLDRDWGRLAWAAHDAQIEIGTALRRFL
jgi:hypothetical protein